MTYPYGVHIAVVEVDPGTGRVQVLRYLVAYEVGRAVNPTMVEGHCGAGRRRASAARCWRSSATTNPASRRRPRSWTTGCRRRPNPRIDLLVSEQAPAPGNPLGVRSAGEGGITAGGATLASAVRDAIGLTGDVGELPLTPPRVLRLVRAAERAR